MRRVNNARSPVSGRLQGLRPRRCTAHGANALPSRRCSDKTSAMRSPHPHWRARAFTAIFILALSWSNAPARDVLLRTPAELYGELFQRVQTERLFVDSKTFADATPRGVPEEILREYEAQKGATNF